MSGATIPYHLRQNKAIDRNVFVDLLARVGRWRNISDYTYVGFGGPYLEEFKQLHGQLRLSKMISLEADPNVVKRQKFNAPLSCIELRNQSSGEFLVAHDFEVPVVVWFDYTEPGPLGAQLAEFELLVRKLNVGDVARITVNASPESLGRPSNAEDDLQTFRLQKASERLANYFPLGAKPSSVTARRYPRLLAQSIENAAKKGMDTKAACMIEPLSVLSYADGQQMLTVTAIILEKERVEEFYSATRLGHWPFKAVGWDAVRPISVPQFSTKERLAVEAMLPGASTPAEVWQQLGYLIGETEAEANELIANFLSYYRLYPWYSRVVL